MVAALYFDGTVKECNVFCDSYEALDEIESWHNVKKISKSWRVYAVCYLHKIADTAEEEAQSSHIKSLIS